MKKQNISIKISFTGLLLRQLAINNPPISRRIFVCLCCCSNGRIAGYATVTTTAKMDKKTSKMGELFVAGCLSSTIFFSPFAHSEITLDGSMGTTGSLTGPDYQITEDLGQRAGGNLFHSFGQFNINSAESATFSGSAGIKNVISRVTGGQTSTIDGVFRSTIPGANVYFLNPAGVIFGENASLDVQGSFHASTADYLKFKDGVKFETGVVTENPILTTASPEAFGFLDDKPAKITVLGGNNKVLSVPENETLSLIGGDININDRSLYAPSGQFILASAGSTGELVINASEIDTSSFTKGGEIHISHAADNPITRVENERQIADIDVSADSAGKVIIRGGQMVMNNATIWADTINGDGGMIDVKLADNLTINSVTEKHGVKKFPHIAISTDSFGKGNAGSILLEINELNLTNKTQIQSIASASGHSGDLIINANSILLEGNDFKTFPKLITKTMGTGNAGNITANATDLVKITNAEISSTTTSEGHAGNINVNSPSIKVTGIDSKISSETELFSTGNAGHILIQTENLKMLDGTKISAKTEGHGLGGDITVNSSTILLSGLKAGFITDTGFVTDSSAIRANSAGNIVVNSDSLDMHSGAAIDTTTLSEADNNSTVGNSSIISEGGSITLNINHINMKESIITASTLGIANAGKIEINTNTLALSNDSEITTSTSGMGQAGNIEIKADNISLNNAGIQSNSMTFDIDNNADTAKSGNIIIDINNTLRLENQSAISVETKKANAGSIEINNGKQLLLSNSKIATSVADSTGSGGNIHIDTPIVALDTSRIIARAKKGSGGDIVISGFLFKSPRSVVDASSQFSEDGNLDLKPETDINGSITMLSGSMLNAQEQMSDLCSSRTRKVKNSFVIKNRGGIPISPGNPTPSTYMDISSTLENDLSPETNNKTVTYLSKSLSNNTICGE